MLDTLTGSHSIGTASSILGDLDIAVEGEDADGLDSGLLPTVDVTRPADVVGRSFESTDTITSLPGRMKVSLSDRPSPDPEASRNSPASSSPGASTRRCTTPWCPPPTSPWPRM